MREIKFRGKCAITGLWAYGFYYPSKGNHIIRDAYDKETIVLKNTVSQFTGQVVENIEVYEGDLITGFISSERDEDISWTKDNPCIVRWREDCAGFYPFTTNARWRSDLMNVKVVGNIHENSEPNSQSK